MCQVPACSAYGNMQSLLRTQTIRRVLRAERPCMRSILVVCVYPVCHCSVQGLGQQLDG